jgi:alkylated DNA repair dioxygenase AlkB
MMEKTGVKRKFQELPTEGDGTIQDVLCNPTLKKQKITLETERPKPRTIFNSPLGHVEYYANFIDRREATKIRDTLIKEVPWEKEQIVIYGQKITAPRLVYSFGDEGVFYRYSGAKRVAAPWHSELLKMKDNIEKQLGDKFNFALVNYYRDGTDYIGFHSDKEGDLVAGASIASVSLGAERDFILMANKTPAQKHSVLLENGSLLFMRGNTQKNYKHSVPKSKTLLKEPRINITLER